MYADIVAKGQIEYAEYPWKKLDELNLNSISPQIEIG